MTYTAKAAVCSEIRTKHSTQSFIQGISPYRAVNTFHHGYKNQSLNDVYSTGRCLF